MPSNFDPIDENEQRPVCCGKKMWKHRGRAQSGRLRYICRSCRASTTASSTEEYEERAGGGYDEAVVEANNQRVRDLVRKGQKRWVVTCAQNNTRTHQGLQALKNYCAETGAELLIIPIHYKNVSLYTASQQYKKSWPADLQVHMVDAHLSLGGGVEVAAELKIEATASRPLSGMQALGGPKWQIIGSPKVLMEPVATPSDLPPKRLYTTGAITVRNYSKTKRGAVAEFHHSVGALVVEVDGRESFVRHLGISGKSLFDVAGGKLREYGPDWVKDHDRIAALTTGDEHVKFHSKSVFKGTYGPNGMATKLRPKYIVRHDVLDGYAGSHHHEKDPVIQFKKFHRGDDDYRAELDQVVRFIDDTTPEDAVNLMVDSNHHDHLLQWLNRVDANKDHRNALLITELQALVRVAAMNGDDVPALALYCRDKLKSDTRWLDRNKPFIIKGVDYSQHGDIGVNGSRGSAASISKTTYKTVIGHSHTARIVDGCYQVGHSASDLEYARGMGTWTHTHCIQYPDGKRTLIDIRKGRWHL
jgi:hypothetical protein